MKLFTPGKKEGFTLIELLVVIAVMVLVFIAIGIRTRTVITRTRYHRAQAEIEAIVLALSSMRVDTRQYPFCESDYNWNPAFFGNNKRGIGLEALSFSSPPAHLGVPSRFWTGPYLPGRMAWEKSDRGFRELLDPWGNPYFYVSLRNIIWGPGLFVRPVDGGPVGGPARPVELDFESVAPGPGQVRVLNLGGMQAARIRLNGDIVVKQEDFRPEHIPQIRNPLTLNPGTNHLSVDTASGQGWWYVVAFTCDETTGYDVFIPGSSGANGKLSGTGYDAPIIHGIFTRIL